MNKSDLIGVLAEKEGLQNKEAFDIVNLVFDGFTKTLKESGRIEIRGFGSFAVRNYRAYTGRNPKTGRTVTVGTKKLPFFKAGKELKARGNPRYHPIAGGDQRQRPDTPGRYSSITVNILMGRPSRVRSAKTRHGSDGPVEDEHKNRHEAREAQVSVAS